MTIFQNFAEMKFKLCGGLDCPDWILAEIASLSSISAIKVKQLATEVILTFPICLHVSCLF